VLLVLHMRIHIERFGAVQGRTQQAADAGMNLT